MNQDLQSLLKTGFSTKIINFHGEILLNSRPLDFVISAIELLQQVVPTEILLLKPVTEKTNKYKKIQTYEIVLFLDQKENIKLKFQAEGKSELSNYLFMLNQLLYDKKIPFQLVALEKAQKTLQITLVNQETYERFENEFVSFYSSHYRIQFTQENQELATKEILASQKWQKQQQKLASKNANFFTQNIHYQWFVGKYFENNAGKDLILKVFNVAFAQKTEGSKQVLEQINSKNLHQFLEVFTEHLQTFEDWFYGQKAKVLEFFVKIILLKVIQTESNFFRLIIEKSYQKNDNKEILNSKLGTAIIKFLLQSQESKALSILLETKNSTKNKNLKKAIEKVWNIQNLDFSENEILEQNVDDFGVSKQSFEEIIADYTAQVFFENPQKAVITWQNSEGKTQKTIPSHLKKTQANKVEKLKSKIKQIKKTLQTQRQHLENAWRNNRTWNFEHWYNYIFNHTLISVFSHNLIWQFETQDKNQRIGFFEETAKQWRDANGVFFDLENITKVRLWHPAEADVLAVLAWREYLFAREILQPFKQAFREIYILTDAEIATKTYSNRFSAHILEQKKLWALTQQRHWEYKGSYGYEMDSPTLKLSAYNLKTDLEVAFPSFEYASTQRLSFAFLDDESPINLTEVPKIAFSEIMRDVDLFVAVSSIGNDPNWTGEAEYEDYWYDYSFGEKSDTASSKTRKEVLEKVVPKLKIAKQCSFEKNFLVVEGQVRTYKINIGSGNILMKPNDQYLCIIPDPKRKKVGHNIFLPFEGDSTLSIILSKAFLLATDEKIEDEVILNQINFD